jgi:hypothetical protein
MGAVDVVDLVVDNIDLVVYLRMGVGIRDIGVCDICDKKKEPGTDPNLGEGITRTTQLIGSSSLPSQA